MRMIGTVTRASSQRCEVTVYQSPACPAECGHQCAGCSSARPFVVTADSSGWVLSVGDRVQLEHTSYHPLLMGALLFLLPLISGMIGYFVVSASEFGLHALGMTGGFLLGFVPALQINRRIKQADQPTHRIAAVVELSDVK